MLAAFTPGIPELLIILAIVLLLFGAKKLPEMARSIGKASGEFKKGVAEGDDDGAKGAAGDASKDSKDAKGSEDESG